MKKRKPITLLLIAAVILFLSLEAVILLNSDKYTPVPSEAVLILGNSLEEGRIPSKITSERLEKGLMLYQNGFCDTIIVSGGKGPSDEIAVADAMQKWLIYKGVPEKNILVENQSANTLENILYAKEIALKYDIEDIILVTSDFHIYRSMLIADKIFDEVTGAASMSNTSLTTFLWYIKEPFSLIKYCIMQERIDSY